jgi:ribosome-associated translation inhibitor RaiA
MIDAVQRLVPEPARTAKVDLVVQPDLAREPVAAHAELHFASTVVRAHATAMTVAVAVDLLAARLRQQLRRAADA